MRANSINPGSSSWYAFLEMGARLVHSPDRLVLTERDNDYGMRY
ncbi:hypothetical protein [Prevotella sp. P6B1]|nr:hypothetical protein [Prevotella sp. P6B1]